MLQTTVHATMAVVAPQSPMTLPYALELLHELEDKLQTPGIRDVVLDLAQVKEVDGSGLGAVVKVATGARAGGQGFYLYRPSKEVSKALQSLEISGFFPMLEYEEDLLAHLPD